MAVTVESYFQDSYQIPFPDLSPGEELPREGEEEGPGTASGLWGQRSGADL